MMLFFCNILFQDTKSTGTKALKFCVPGFFEHYIYKTGAGEKI